MPDLVAPSLQELSQLGKGKVTKLESKLDIYRPPGSKDVSGWHGPATIVDLTNIPRGIISVRSNNVVEDVMVGDARRHLAFPCFMSAYLAGYHRQLFAGGPGCQQEGKTRRALFCCSLCFPYRGKILAWKMNCIPEGEAEKSSQSRLIIQLIII